MTRRTLIVDSETTSLTPDYETGTGVIWELAAVDHASGAAHLWRMKPDLSVADPGALRVGKFYERTAGMCKDCTRPYADRAYDLAGDAGTDPHWSSPPHLAAEVARLLDDVTIVAANPAFDAGFLTAFLRANGQAPTWHYRLRDVGSMAWAWLLGRQQALAGTGYTGPRVPAIDASTDEFARALGLNPDREDRHSALGDCMLAGAMLDVIMGPAS